MGVARLLEEKRKSIADVCARRGVARLEAFGSALREDFSTDTSDLDLLVEFQPMEPYARVEAYFGLLDDLRDMFGRKIDLVMADAVKNRYLAQDIQRTKQPLYAS